MGLVLSGPQAVEGERGPGMGDTDGQGVRSEGQGWETVRCRKLGDPSEPLGFLGTVVKQALSPHHGLLQRDEPQGGVRGKMNLPQAVDTKCNL